MRTMHLFAGIGGGLLADLILGHKPIIAVEWDKYACQVLRERASNGWFPGLQVWEGDVRLFNPSEYTGKVDCIHAGFPCQDISNAGKQAGVEEGTRSGLYREVLRIAGVVRPRYLFLENVSAILSVGLGTVLGDLASRGYDARWLCIKASDVGANHRRDRWFLLAYTKSERERGGERDIPKEDGRQVGQMRKQLIGASEESENMAYSNSIGQFHIEPKEQSTEGRINALSDTSAGCEDVADTSSIRQPGQGESFGQINTTQNCYRKADRTIYGSEGREGWWKSEPGLGRVVDGVSDRMGKLKGYGNAQVPLQAAVAFSLLYEGLQ